MVWQVHPTGSSVVNKAGRNAVITSLMVCCGFIVCWSPNQILFLLSNAGYSVDFGGWFYHFTSYILTPNLLSHQSNQGCLFSFVRYTITLFAKTVTQIHTSVSFYPPSMRSSILPTGSITSPWFWCSSAAVSTLSSTLPSTASSSTASDVSEVFSPDSSIRSSPARMPAILLNQEASLLGRRSYAHDTHTINRLRNPYKKTGTINRH